MSTLSNVAQEIGDNETPKGTGLTTCGLPVNSKDGVSTLYMPQWYVLRVAYGKEAIANQCLLDNGIETYYPMHNTKKLISGKYRKVKESYIPNIFFAYGTFNELKNYVFDNFHQETKHMRFYYTHFLDGTKEPVTVPESQMEKLKLICDSLSENIVIRPGEMAKFKEGQHVRVMEGPFAGLEGIVARYHGQQRVGITIKGLLTIATAYVPSAFLRKL